MNYNGIQHPMHTIHGLIVQRGQLPYVCVRNIEKLKKLFRPHYVTQFVS